MDVRFGDLTKRKTKLDLNLSFSGKYSKRSDRIGKRN